MLLTLALVAACACGRDEPAIVVSQLPLYTQDQLRLYDDSMATEVFDREAVSSPSTELFRERVLGADFIVPVRLVAINAERSEDTVRYQLVAQPSGDPLSGSLAAGPLELSVGRGSPSQSMLRAMDTQLVGSLLIVIARRFQREGEIVVHFRAEPDTVQIREAVTTALASRDAQSAAAPSSTSDSP